MFYTVINAPACHALNSAEQSFLFVENYFDISILQKYTVQTGLAEAVTLQEQFCVHPAKPWSQTKIVIVKFVHFSVYCLARRRN